MVFQNPTFTLLLTVLVLACGVLAALHALLTKRDARAAFGWVAFCLVLPLFGPMIYLIFGINRIKETAHRLFSDHLENDQQGSIHDPPGNMLRPLSSVGENVTRRGLHSCDSITLLENGDALYPSMLEAIASAHSRVYLSSYIIDNDPIGQEFIQALCAAQSRGVDVRVIIDGLGEYMSFPRIGARMRRCGLNFSRFNPITLVPPALHINMRNHRKILVIDGRVAYTGGQNIGCRHLVTAPQVNHPVIDLHFRFTGKIVDELEHAFLSDWQYCRRKVTPGEFRPQNRNRPDADIWTRLVLDGPNRYLDRLNDLIVGVISSAQHRVWIMTPYFLPGNDIVAALVGARLRGVDVKVVLPDRNNIFLVHWAMQNTLPYYIEKNIEIYYQPPPFVHTKALLIDDNYSMIGSANLDSRSLRLNFELGIEVFDRATNRHLTDYFQPRLAAARPVTQADLRKLSAPVRVRNALAWLFSPYL